MLSLYRVLLTRAAARPLALACALAWLAFTSYGLAIILVVHAATGSFRVAGAAVAAFSAGSGLAAPARGHFIDKRGPQGLILFTAAHACAGGAFVVACVLHAPTVTLLGGAGVAGFLAPPLIATARATWTDIAGPDLVRAAHALNASLADVGQLVSPGFTGILAVAFAPSWALVILIAGASSAGIIIAITGRRRSTGAAPEAPRGRFWGVIIQSSGLRTLVVCDLAAGLWAGALEVSVTALASHRGAAELAALPLSAMAVGGIVASLWVGSRSVSPAPDRRYLAGSLLVGAALPLTLLEPSLPSVTSIAVAAGAGYGVLGAALFELLDYVVPPARAVEAFTWLTTAQAAGSAVGAGLAGMLARNGTTRAFALVAICAMTAAGLAVARRATLSASGPRV